MTTSTKPSKKSIKQAAQDMLISQMMTAFLKAGDENASDEVFAALEEQARRVEKLFGYTPGSWAGANAPPLPSHHQQQTETTVQTSIRPTSPTFATIETMKKLPYRYYLIGGDGMVNRLDEHGQAISWAFDQRPAALRAAERRDGVRCWDKELRRFIEA